MNYSRAFTFVFEDKNWLSKILIAGLISLIPIVGQLYLMGWTVEIVRRVKAGRTDVLPTTHFTYFLTLGLKLFVVALIYSIPVIILSAIMQLFTSSAGNTDSDIFTVFFAGLGCIGGILSLVINIAVALLGTYGTIKLAETDQIKACLDFQDAFNTIKNNITTFIIVELLAIVAGLIEGAGLIICIGIIFTVPYGTAVIANLIGQLWDNLKTGNGKAKPFRSIMTESASDIIEEAPFTRVQDIEEKAEEVKEDIHEVLEEAAEVKEEVQETVEEAAETVAAEAEEIKAEAEDVVEDVVEKITDEPAPAAEEEKPADDNNDLPSFE